MGIPTPRFIYYVYGTRFYRSIDIAIFYHSLYSGLGYTYVKPDTSYSGSDRNYLSFLLGGPVGFAYAYLPKCWEENPTYNKYQLIIHDDALVFLGKDYNDVPREEDQDWDGRCVLVTARKAIELCSTPGHTYAEVAFLASDVLFGNPLQDLLKDAKEVLGIELYTPEQALLAVVNKVVEMGLKEKELNSMYTGDAFVGLNLPYPNERYEDLVHSYAHKDFSSVHEWLMNKPHMAMYLLLD